MPARVFACCSALPSLGQVRAEANHVSGCSLRKILSFCHSNASERSFDLFCHFASSAHKPSCRLAPVMEVHTIFGWGRVRRKFQLSIAITAVFPGPLQPC